MLDTTMVSCRLLGVCLSFCALSMTVTALLPRILPTSRLPSTHHQSHSFLSANKKNDERSDGNKKSSLEWSSTITSSKSVAPEKRVDPPASSTSLEPSTPRPQFPFGTIVERTLDTVEDAVIHLRRVPYDWGWIRPDPTEKARRKTVVVLGSGWAAHAFFKIADTFKLRVIVVSPVNHFLFTPMLASAAVGTVEYRSMTEAVRAANPMIEEYVEGAAIDLDINKKVVKVQLNSLLKDVRSGKPPIVEFEYDHLLVAVGCKVADTLVPGAAQHTLRLKTCDDARRLRIAVGECLEYASRPDVSTITTTLKAQELAESEKMVRQTERRQRVTFCIVGGGPTGVELAGELSDFVQDITKPRIGVYARLRNDVQIVLIQTGRDLVPQFEPPLRKHALESLLKAGVDVRLDTRVIEAGDGYIKILSKATGKEEKLSVGLTVWAAGTGPVPFVETLLRKLPPEAQGQQASGKIMVDKWLRCPTPTPETFGSILVMGDAAAFVDSDKNAGITNNKGEGRTSYLPQTAQVAGQQGAFAARMLCRDYDMTVTPPKIASQNNLLPTWMMLRGLTEAAGFTFLNLGLLAYVGDGEALSQIQIGDVPVLSYAGSISFVLWRSVYLVKQVATRNRVLVTFDWMKSALFGRDITRL